MLVTRMVSGNVRMVVVKNLGHWRWLPAALAPTHSRLWRRVAAHSAAFEMGFWLDNLYIFLLSLLVYVSLKISEV